MRACGGSWRLMRASATAKSGPLGWDALTHLCFSKFLRLDKTRSDSFVSAATALLDAGASANTGFFEMEHQPKPEWESALYGAAGVAHHAALTRLLLERGADPNDNEVPYHTPETYDNDALKVLVESGTAHRRQPRQRCWSGRPTGTTATASSTCWSTAPIPIA